MVEPPWTHGLDTAGLDIASSTASPLRVCAGPGTGKTFSLMRRVWRLIHEGADPERIFVVTFTRTAARDLVTALQDLGVPGADKVRASTLHGFCFGALQKASVFQVTGRTPRLLMDFETKFLRQDLKRPGRSITDCKRFIKAFEASWARLQSENPGWPTGSNEQAFHQDLMAWLRFHKAMLVGELASEMYNYLRNNPLCPERHMFDLELPLFGGQGATR